MKSVSLLLIMFFMLGLTQMQTVSAQKKSNPYQLDVNDATWLGVDFSQLRVMGEETLTESDLQDKYYPGMNDVIVNEPKKYQVDKTFKVKNVENDLTYISKSNKGAEMSAVKTMKSADLKHLSADDVKKLVGSYHISGGKGKGILFVAEGFNKPKSEAYYFVTIVDMSNGSVVETRRLAGKAGGFGFRNYWVRTIYEVFDLIQKGKVTEVKADK